MWILFIVGICAGLYLLGRKQQAHTQPPNYTHIEPPVDDDALYAYGPLSRAEWAHELDFLSDDLHDEHDPDCFDFEDW